MIIQITDPRKHETPVRGRGSCRLLRVTVKTYVAYYPMSGIAAQASSKATLGFAGVSMLLG